MADSILVRIAAGDHSAVRECIDCYGGLVWTLARRWGESAADAEDAAQEIFLQVWKSASRYDPAKGDEKAFVSTIARRRLIDRFRAGKRHPSMVEFTDELSTQPEFDPSHESASAADTEAAAKVLAQLDPSQREILVLGLVEGMSHSEIAHSTGKPLGTVKTHMRRGLQKIRALIDDPGANTG